MKTWKAFSSGRDAEIRTRGLTHPKGARYQAAPRPVKKLFQYERKTSDVKAANAGSIISAWFDLTGSQPRLHPVDQVSPEAVSQSGSAWRADRQWDLQPALPPVLSLVPN